MEIRVCLVDAVIALAAIGGDKREALCGNILKHVVLRVRKRLVETKQRPLQFESPSLVASWFAQSTFCPPSQTAFPKNLLKFFKMWKIFSFFSMHIFLTFLTRSSLPMWWVCYPISAAGVCAKATGGNASNVRLNALF